MTDIRPIHVSAALPLLRRFHSYGSMSNTATYAFGVFESEVLVAVYLWQPPPPGAAKSACPEAPHGVLALSRMAALPKSERALRHVSRPLRAIMRRHIDRGRWPVLVTYSDESLGHTGHVYLCSGWQKTVRSETRIFLDENGRRVSRYSCGKHKLAGKTRAGYSHVQRWEHWACERGKAAEHIAAAGWVREELHFAWRSGKQAGRWVRATSPEPSR